MCTLSYLPTTTGCIFTSSRDEAPGRAAKNISHFETASGIKVLYPKDPQAGGSWIACNSNGRIACLINGANKKHERASYYAKSRGLVLLDAMRAVNFENFSKDYDLKFIEAFTLIVSESDKLYELQWNEKQKELKEHDANKAVLWASHMLYKSEVIEKRKQWFSAWLNDHPIYKANDIVNFHQFGGHKDLQNGLRIDRAGIVKTVSITSIELVEFELKMSHRDFINNTLQEKSLSKT